MSECSAREARKRVTLRRSLGGARLAPRIGSRRRAMGWTNIWLLLIGGAMLSAACATHRELMVAVVDQTLFAMTNLTQSAPPVDRRGEARGRRRSPDSIFQGQG